MKKDRKEQVLSAVLPICEAYKNIVKIDCDYIIDPLLGSEFLKVNGVLIACSGNSIGAIVDELTGYIFVKTFCKNRWMGAFEPQMVSRIKEYWVKGLK